LVIWEEVIPGAILTKCGMWADMVDIITCGTFHDCRLRGVGVVRGIILPSPIDLRYCPYNTGPCDRVIPPLPNTSVITRSTTPFPRTTLHTKVLFTYKLRPTSLPILPINKVTANHSSLHTPPKAPTCMYICTMFVCLLLFLFFTLAFSSAT